MKLFFSGHAEKYAAEQTMLMLFPGERPEYPDTPPGGDNELELTFTRGREWSTAAALLRRDGKTFLRRCRCRTDVLDGADRVEAVRQLRRTLQRAFYLAAVDCIGAEPPWGMLSGVRPVKLPVRAIEGGDTPRQAERMLRDTYHVSPARRALAMDCAAACLEVKNSLRPEEFSLYAGIPFCPTRCAYCSFISASGAANRLIPDYLEVLLRETEAAGRNAIGSGRRVKSAYIGGGTPTTLSAPQLGRLLGTMRRSFELADDTELTVEAGRPDTITAEKLAVLREHGCGRVSVNPQSLSDEVLCAIGRSHSAADTLRAYELVRRYDFTCVNTDLIAGLPADTPETFRQTLDAVLDLAPENITVHTLALKRGARLRHEAVHIPGGAEVDEMLSYAWDALRGAGYVPYYLYRQKFMSGGFENIGWTKPGLHSIYNICMMEELHTVVSLGAGGVTKAIDGPCVRRLSNPKYPQEYLREAERLVAEKASFFAPFPAAEG